MVVGTDLSGTLLSAPSFGAVPKELHLYVGRCKLETTGTAIKEWLAHKNPSLVAEDILPLPVQEGYRFRAFRVSFSHKLSKDVLAPEVWPAGVTIRKFFQQRKGSRGDVAGSSFKL